MLTARDRRNVLIWCLLALFSVSFNAAAHAKPPSGDFPTFGLQLVPPPQAIEGVANSPGQIAVYQLQGASAGAVIVVEIVPGEGQSIDDAAKALAAKAQARVEPAGFPVGSEKAVKFTQAISDPVLTTRTSYIITHDGWEYVISGLSSPTASASAALEAMLKTVKFVPAQQPAKYLKTLSDQPLAVFGRFSMNVPRMLRPVNVEEKMLHLGIYDYTQKGKLGNPLNLEIDRIQLPNRQTFADIRDAYSKALQTQLKAPSPFVWQAKPNVPGLNVSQPMKLTTKLEDGSETTNTRRFAILELAPGDLVQIVFTCSQASAPDVPAYMDLSDRMLGTIKIIPEATTR